MANWSSFVDFVFISNSARALASDIRNFYNTNTRMCVCVCANLLLPGISKCVKQPKQKPPYHAAACSSSRKVQQPPFSASVCVFVFWSHCWRSHCHSSLNSRGKIVSSQPTPPLWLLSGPVLVEREVCTALLSCGFPVWSARFNFRETRACWKQRESADLQSVASIIQLGKVKINSKKELAAFCRKMLSLARWCSSNLTMWTIVRGLNNVYLCRIISGWYG